MLAIHSISAWVCTVRRYFLAIITDFLVNIDGTRMHVLSSSLAALANLCTVLAANQGSWLISRPVRLLLHRLHVPVV